MAAKSHFVGVRMPADLVESAKEVAAAERRTLSNYILDLIARDLEKRQSTIIGETRSTYGAVSSAHAAAAAVDSEVGARNRRKLKEKVVQVIKARGLAGKGPAKPFG